MIFRDSVGNTYTRLPAKPPNHTAKATKSTRKHGRNLAKCATYRAEGRRETNKTARSARRWRVHLRALERERLIVVIDPEAAHT